MTKVGEMVSQWLKQHGADGLCTEGCGCDGTHPCGNEIPGDCVAAVQAEVRDDGTVLHPQTGEVLELLAAIGMLPGEWTYVPLLSEEEIKAQADDSQSADQACRADP